VRTAPLPLERSTPTRLDPKHIAVIGAGAAGACAALELAARGYRVTLFERGQQAVAEASYVNEGKVHLGFIYAMDGSRRTARKMIEGALVFEDYLKRWTDYNAAAAVSTPFFYGVHRGSLMALPQLIEHYTACVDYYRQRAAATGLDYLGLGVGAAFERVPEVRFPHGINPEYIEHLLQTTEYAVDPRHIAGLLRESLAAESRVTLFTEHAVTGVEPSQRGGYRVAVAHNGETGTAEFSQVVNAAWFRRLPLDRPLGIVPSAPWSHRYKFGNRVAYRLQPDQLPSLTCVQGPFGDVVNFGERGFFLSWYPTGRTGMSVEEVPPEWDAGYSREQRMVVFRRSLGEWRLRCADLARLDYPETAVDPAGGVIYALGTEDVDHRTTRLHDRYAVGIQSRDGYHSVDTGKYTLAPLTGMAIADRVCGVA